MQGEKKSKREEHRAVCVIKLLAPASETRAREALFLLVKRAEKGLLAGLSATNACS